MIRWPYRWRKIEACPGIIPHFGGVQYRVDCLMENGYIRLAKLPKNGLNCEARKEKVIVSLTTFPARIEQCFYAIKSLMLQDYKADKIILWLAESQFPNHQLPPKYQQLISAGLMVRYCEDLRSHKKYFYALQEQKSDELVITFDDDIIFEENAISKLIKMHQKYPNCIICNRGLQMTVSEQKILPYQKWKLCTPLAVDHPAYAVMPSTGAGCLYPYGIMPKETFDIEEAKRLAWSADDLWMRFNSLSAGVLVVKTREKIATLCNVTGSQREALTRFNNLEMENNRVIERLLQKFPDVTLRCLMEEKDV